MVVHENLVQLKAFVQDKKLKDQYSNISFGAKVQLQTEHNYLETTVEVQIRFDGYNSCGKLTLLDKGNNINPLIFPEDFEAKWQEFKYNNSDSLLIMGKHPKRAIGNYKVRIYPISNDIKTD